MKKRRLVSLTMAALMGVTMLTGCGGGTAKTDATTAAAGTEASSTAASSTAAPAGDSGKKEVLEFYHGYYHDESEWAPAKVMRDIYDEFAKQHADGSVEFKAIPTEDLQSVVDNKVAGGGYPDIVDMAGSSISLAAVTQNLLYDMKPYIDQENIADKVGLNYTQNQRDGKIFTVHDQLLTIGFWYNQAVFKAADAATPDTWTSWEDFNTAMANVRKNSKDGIYAYGAGEGSTRCFNSMLGATDAGAKMVTEDINTDTINSKEFEQAFKETAKFDQQNGSANASTTANDWSADFNAGKSAIFFNGVWAAGGFGDSKNFQPAIFPGKVALSSAGGGITIASNMSDAKTKLALEFVKYMTSDEVQEKIFTQVGANPCNGTLDLNKLAEGASASTQLLATACSQANSAAIIVPTIEATWGTDISNAIANKLIECTVTGVDVDAKFEELKSELTGLIG